MSNTSTDYLAQLGEQQRQQRAHQHARTRGEQVADLSTEQLRTMLAYLKNIRPGTFRLLAGIMEDLKR